MTYRILLKNTCYSCLCIKKFFKLKLRKSDLRSIYSVTRTLNELVILSIKNDILVELKGKMKKKNTSETLG